MTDWFLLGRNLLRELERGLRPSFDLVVGPTFTEDSKMGAIVRMTEGQRTRLSLNITNKRLGRPAKIDGKPEWKLTGNDTVTLNVAADGMTAIFRAPPGSEGSARVQVTADADLGAGFEPITSEADVIIAAASANQIDIVPDAPEDDDVTPPAPAPAPTPTPTPTP